MGLLNRFFRSPEVLARELVDDDTKIIAIWEDYVASTKEKGQCIEALKPGIAFPQLLRRIKDVLASELVKTAKEQKTEKELIKDLQALEHQEHVQRVKRLEHTIGYAATKHQYIYHLLKELWDALATELAIVNTLLGGSEKKQFFIQKLNELWHVEQHLIAQIRERETFHQLFRDLLTREHIIARLTERQKKQIPSLRAKMHASQGMVSNWVNKVYAGIGDAVTQALADNQFGNQRDSDYEFVNSLPFVDFVRAIKNKENPEASDDTVAVFVHLFREWYNAQLKL